MTAAAQLELRVARLEAALLGGADAAPIEFGEQRSVREMVQFVAFQTGLRATDLVGMSRERVHARARFAVVWGCRRVLGLSTTIIGRRLSDRDHSSILHASSRAEQEIARDPAFALLTRRIEHAFGDKETKQ